MRKERESEATPQEIVAAALNEQGYLLQHKIMDVLRSPAGDEKYRHDWRIEAAEVPVSLPNGEETKIDLVLRPSGVTGQRTWRIVTECKRSARDYKRWVFFGGAPSSLGPSPDYYHIERADFFGTWDHRGSPPMAHRVERCGALRECPIFDFGVEARMNRSGSEKRSSATTAIEDAFQQVMLGQAGLASRLRDAHELHFRLFPVVVTTAELVSARFSNDHVSLEDGMIQAKDLALEPRQWLAVNARMNDLTCRATGVTVNRNTDLASDIAAWQVRTVFVVQAVHMQHFLAWLEHAFS